MDDNTTDPRLDRRAAIRRGAVLGGAVLWTAPMVQTLGMRSAAAMGTPVPGGGDCMSHLDLKLEFEGRIWCLKFPDGDFNCGANPPTAQTHFGGHPSHSSGQSGHCLSVADCGEIVGEVPETPSGTPVVTTSSADGGHTWSVQIPAGAKVLEAYSKGCRGGSCVAASCPPGTVGPVTCFFGC